MIDLGEMTKGIEEMKGETIEKTPEIKNVHLDMMIAEILEVGMIDEVLKEETLQKKTHTTVIEEKFRE